MKKSLYLLMVLIMASSVSLNIVLLVKSNKHDEKWAKLDKRLSSQEELIQSLQLSYEYLGTEVILKHYEPEPKTETEILIEEELKEYLSEQFAVPKSRSELEDKFKMPQHMFLLDE